MIRLFRNIRHNLLSGNDYGRYIIYASGEILLVVIGILMMKPEGLFASKVRK